MGAVRNLEVRRDDVSDRAPISGVRSRVRPEEEEAPVSIVPVSLAAARLTTVANANASTPEELDELPLEEAVPLSTNAALAVIFGASMAVAGLVALLPLL